MAHQEYIGKNVWLNTINLHCHVGLPAEWAKSLAGYLSLDRRYIRIDTVPGRMGTIASLFGSR
jgi:hypothetical protein